MLANKFLPCTASIFATAVGFAALAVSSEVVVHRADLSLIATCQRVNFDFARYRRPGEYGLIAERAGPLV